MVDMGSKKYPDENEYFRFIWKTGGEIYAGVDLDSTLFSFETYEEYLDEALDRFSQMFKAPLMLKEAMTRERETVDSEFEIKKTDDATRNAEVVSSIGQTNHPSSIFTWGNLKTLKHNISDDELYHKAHDFRKRHYSAHRMYVCLQSNQSLDNLQVRIRTITKLSN